MNDARRYPHTMNKHPGDCRAPISSSQDVCVCVCVFLRFIRPRTCPNNWAAYLPDIDSSCLLSLGVPVTKLCHCSNGIEAGVLCQGEWDDLQCLSKLPETVLLHTSHCISMLHKAEGQLDLGGTTSSYQGPGETTQKCSLLIAVQM